MDKQFNLQTLDGMAPVSTCYTVTNMLITGREFKAPHTRHIPKLDFVTGLHLIH